MSKKSIPPHLQAQIDVTMQQGLQLHQSGQIQQAAQRYQQILQVLPKHAGANHYLGVIAHQTGDNAKAEKLIRKALQADPKFIQAYNNMGVVLRAQNKLVEAQKNYQKVLRLKPDYADALSNLGIISHELGQSEQAVEYLEQAVQQNPKQIDAFNALGIVYRALGQTEKAIESYQQTLVLAPDYAEAHNNLGNLYGDLGDHAQAIESLTRAVELKPAYAEAHANLGNVYLQEGQLDHADKHFKQAYQLKPEHADFLFNLGLVEQHRGHYQAAYDIYQKVLDMQADHILAHSCQCLLMNYSNAFGNNDIFARHRAWEQTARAHLPKKLPAPRKKPNIHNERIKVGYISADFRQHSVYYFFEPLLREHNRDHFEVFCYYNAGAQDHCTERLKDLSEHWRPVAAMSDLELIKQIQKDKIDILVDLSGHTSGHRLAIFMARPAPIQMTWLGYPNTSGLSEMDYRITDAIADPEPQSESFHSEQLIRLPNGFLCYDGDDSLPYAAESPCHSHDKITFGSFNNLSKVTDEVIAAWSKILIQAPKANLLLKCKQLADDKTQQSILAKFAAYGVDEKRIELKASVASFEEHLALYETVDIGLDTFPYNGTTTTFEALWMGVPTLTLQGDRHAARVGASIMTNIQLEEFVTHSLDSYIQKAVSLASQPAKITELRPTLREKLSNSKLCDAKAFAQQMEAAYETALSTKNQ